MDRSRFWIRPSRKKEQILIRPSRNIELDIKKNPALKKEPGSETTIHLKPELILSGSELFKNCRSGSDQDKWIRNSGFLCKENTQLEPELYLTQGHLF